MADDEKNDIVREREGEEEEKSGGGNTKLFIIVGAVLVLAAVAFVYLQMGSAADEEQQVAGKAKVKNEESFVDFVKLKDKPVLLIELGELTCSLRPRAVGDSRRRKIKLDPVLILKPYYNYELQMFDQEQNNAMMERFTTLIPLLRQIVINIVLDSDPNEEPDTRTLEKRIMKHVNNYDSTTKEVKGNYDAFFGQDRVLKVYFKTFEPR